LKSPQLVYLNPSARQIAEHAVLVLGRHFARFNQQPGYRLLLTPVMRTVERIEQPSIRQFRIAARVEAFRRFMMTPVY